MSLTSSCLSLQAQFDEIEALQSIYGDAWKSDIDSPGSYAIDISEGGHVVSLFVHLNEDYPAKCPPTYTISAPALTKQEKNHITTLLDEIYLNNLGESILYQWVESIREYLSSLLVSSEAEDAYLTETHTLEIPEDTAVPEIFHGDVIMDRKSSFQGHVATVTSISEVQTVLRALKGNRKIANATHNMYAYRISLGNQTFSQDCDDDGESQAGGRLLHLLQIVGATNVIVVVSRWYGGILLGSDRFRHINNAARQVLQANNLLPPSK